MTTATVSKLHIEKFRKVHALMTGGATEGERAAARARAEAIAARSGMTLQQAVSKMADCSQQASAPTTTSWEDYWAEKQPERDARWAKAEKEHGPAEKAFAETPEEVRLRIFLEPYETYSKYSNVDKLYVDGYVGWGRKYPNREAFRKVLDKAIPFPANLPDLIAEWEKWEALSDLRYAYDADYEMHVSVRARMDILEQLIQETPVRHWDDMDVRMKWLRAELDKDRWRDRERNLVEYETLKADLDFLRTLGPTVQNGRRTNSDKAAAVTDLLKSNPELSDREISRRVGVSPQTVSNWRARLRGKGEPKQTERRAA